ncbi:ATP-dependent helicase HrpA [Raineyella antarctica]|uniref:ATP-dependent helicase HrpA n=1 Tax=Raineyella antarctica TaxID=1577474 RepID=A0A1G6GQA7_9ACTN|nr:ATP-dependent helicase HrpA [Raineyella antarctica]
MAGETGSGKTTQLPKLCLQLGRQRIAHTQPRRLAARTVAERIASEMAVELGQEVGYQVRFTRKAQRSTALTVMTDGILLAGISHDRDLRSWDTIIIDEAHERSLNIDFLLGYLKQLLPRRKDLKVIVTSATIDTERFSRHFDDAPVIEVSGRTYPVDVRYRPLVDDGSDEGGRPAVERDQNEGICEALLELSAEAPGDVLVFLSGEREIRDAAQAIEDLKLPRTEILPLYARLTSAEQQRVFSPHTGRRIVLATNVAETSLTVPGIRYVIDPGTARISRYSTRTKVQRLPIEPVSQASANQRAGRCGRVAPGICIRLYSEQDFAARPEFTEPEILRTNLASVILQMAQAGLGDIERFPFVEPPESAQITDGMRLLDELGALSPNATRTQPRLTKVGHALARIPLDPRMGRMLLAGDHYGCLREMVVLVAGLTIQDPRERPREQREKADQLHRRFWAPMAAEGEEAPDPDGSDFVALLRLWDYLTARRRDMSGNAFRRMCHEEYLNYLRIREWQDLQNQLRDICRDLEMTRNELPADADRVHMAVLTGLLSHVGLADLKDEKKSTPRDGRGRPRRGPREYLGARGTRFAISPGSALAKRPPELVMANELVETSRLWAHTVAGIRAQWIEEIAGPLLKRHYAEPHWAMRAGQVVAYETASLYGVPIIGRRQVAYGGVDPVAAREIFLRSALVEGQWHTRHHFWSRNEATRRRAEELEERTRRRDIVVDDQAIFDFYDARVPADICTVAGFDAWWRRKRQQDDAFLDLAMDDLVQDSADIGSAGDFPDTWQVGEHTLDVEYVFDPGAGADGVSVRVPLPILSQLPSEPFSWQVPGLRLDLVTQLIRSLPKAHRTRVVPAPDWARRLLGELDASIAAGELDPERTSLTRALTARLATDVGLRIADDEWDLAKLPEHLRVTFVVLSPREGKDGGGTEMARSKDLAALQQEHAGKVAATLSKASRAARHAGSTTWEFGELPREVTIERHGTRATGYPALTDEGTTVGSIVQDTPARAATSHRAGLRRLVVLNTPDPTRWVVSHLSNPDKFTLGSSPYASVPELLADARLKSVADLVAAAVDPTDIRDAAAFRRLCDTVRQDNPEHMRRVVAVAAEVLRADQQASLALASVRDPDVMADVTEQRANLVFPGFIAATEGAAYERLPVYLKAIGVRLAALPGAALRDRQAMETVNAVEDAYAELCAAQPPGRLRPEVEEIGWLIEELRVSLFAQTLGTRTTVSAKRVRKAIERAAA